MATQTNEAKIVVSAQDNTAGAFSSVTAHFNQMTASADMLKTKLHGIGNGAFTNLTGALGSLQGKMAALGIGAGVGAAVGGLAAVRTAYQSVINTAEKADRIDDLGGRLRLNAEEFQVFEKLSKDAGASVEEAGAAFLKFKLNIGTAQSEGGKKLEKLSNDLQAFGITAGDAANMKPLDLMKRMGLVSSKSDTEADEMLKIEKFRALAGKTGATLIPVFEAIGTKYDATVKKMRDAGTLMNDDMAKQGGAAFKAYEKSKGAMDGLKMGFGIQMLPVFEQFSKVMEDRMKANRTAMQPGVKALSDVLSSNIKPFLDDMDGIADKTSGVFKVIGKLAGLVGWDRLIFGSLALIAAPFVVSIFAAVKSILILSGSLVMPIFTTLITGLRAATVSFALMQGASLSAWAAVLAPIVLVIAGVAAVAAAAYLIYNNWGGMSSFFAGVWESVSAAFEPISPLLSGVGAVFSWLGSVIVGAKDWFMSLLGPVGDSAAGFQDWSNSGRTAGAVIATTLQALLVPVYLAIDAFKLLGASWDWLNNKEFNFKSSTAKALTKNHFSEALNKNSINDTTKLAGIAPTAPVAAVAGIAKQASVGTQPLVSPAVSNAAVLVGATGATGATGYVGQSGIQGAAAKSVPLQTAFATVNPPVAFATPSFTIPPIPPAKVDIGGRLDVRIASDGRATVERAQSNNRNYEIDARAGAMYAAGA
jgi:hypothetical protein